MLIIQVVLQGQGYYTHGTGPEHSAQRKSPRTAGSNPYAPPGVAEKKLQVLQGRANQT